MNDWVLRFEGYAPEQEGLREVLCTLGNGYLATRGAAQEVKADGVHYPGTYLAGCYNRLDSEVGGHWVENEDLVNCPNWLPLRFRIGDGVWLEPGQAEVLYQCRELDLRAGVLRNQLRLREAGGRITRLCSERLVHMGTPHLAATRTEITAENWSGRLEGVSALDGRVQNGGVERYQALSKQHLRPVAEGRSDRGHLLLEVETSQSHIRIAQAARTCLYRDGSPLPLNEAKISHPGYVAAGFGIDLLQGDTVTVEKTAAIYSSRDRAISAPAAEADGALAAAGDFAALRAGHALAWAQLWRRFDFDLDASPAGEPGHTELLLRLHMFHLLQVASSNVQHVDAGVPARGLHGEAYRGHVFWDEIFILPTLIYRMPEIARALLMYRWYRLGAARQAAREAGYAGAMYPWQSGSNGREETQRLHLNPRSGRWLEDNTYRQRHVGLAVAYNVWHYYAATDDHEFLAAYGAEMLLEIARFVGSLARHDAASGRYEIRGVMGPDEYHDGYPDAARPAGVDNNAYTNVMAAWTLQVALEVLERLSAERRKAVCAQLCLEPPELRRWEAISRGLRVDFHDGHIISQFQGYAELTEFDWQGYARRYGDIQRLDRILEAEGDTPNRYKLSKQADVLMLFFLFSAEELRGLFHRLGYPFERQWIPDNVAYYSARTCHGSSLSRVVHAWVLSRSQRTRSWKLFQEALQTDYGDVPHGTTREGIHLGAMSGTVDLMLRCYTGMEVRDDALYLKPRLPREIGRLCMNLHFRGRALRLRLEASRMTVTVFGPESLRIGIRDVLHEIAPGRPHSFPLPRHGEGRDEAG